MRPPNDTAPNFGRTLAQILDTGSVGLRWADNIGPVSEPFDYLDAQAPYDVAVPGLSAPPFLVLAVVENKDDPTEPKMAHFPAWTWAAGKVRVHSIDVTTTAETYRVRLATVRS